MSLVVAIENLGGVTCSFPFVLSTGFVALKMNPPVITGRALGWTVPPVFESAFVGIAVVPNVNPDPENTPVVTLDGSLFCCSVPGFAA